jgi:hypothetical protein
MASWVSCAVGLLRAIAIRGAGRIMPKTLTPFAKAYKSLSLPPSLKAPLFREGAWGAPLVSSRARSLKA